MLPESAWTIRSERRSQNGREYRRKGIPLGMIDFCMTSMEQGRHSLNEPERRRVLPPRAPRAIWTQSKGEKSANSSSYIACRMTHTKSAVGVPTNTGEESRRWAKATRGGPWSSSN